MGDRKKGKSLEIKEVSGRKQDKKQVLDQLQKGRPVAIVAPRRFGKTALVKQLLQDIAGAGKATLYMDLLSKSTPGLLSTSIIKETLKNHKLHREFQAALKSKGSFYSHRGLRNLTAAFPVIARLDDDSLDEWEILNQCMDFPDSLGRSLNQHMICAYDGVGTRSNSDSAAKLSGLLSEKAARHSHALFLLSGRSASLFPPLKKIYVHRLDYLEQAWLIQSFREKLSRLKIKISRDDLSNLVTYTRGHPYYSRIAFQQILLVHAQSGFVPGSKELIRRVLAAERGYLEKAWEDLSNNQEYLHTMMALSKGSSNIYGRLKSKKINVARAQKNLEGMGYLLKIESGGYRIADPVLAHWLRKNS